MQDSGHPVPVGGQGSQCGLQRLRVAYVAGEHGDRGAGLREFGGQLGHAGRLVAAPAEQGDVAGAAGGHRAGQVRAERAVGTGDQHGARRLPGGVGPPGRALVAHQTAYPGLAVAHRPLVLRTGSGQDAEQQRGVLFRGLGGQVHESAPAARELQRGDPAQTPDLVLAGVLGRLIPGAHGSGGDRPQGHCGVLQCLDGGDRQRQAAGHARQLRVRALVQREQGEETAEDGSVLSDPLGQRGGAAPGRVAPVGAQQRLGLDGVAGPGAPCRSAFDGGGLSSAAPVPGRSSASRTYTLLRGAVGGGHPVGGAVLVDRGAADDGQHLVPEPPGVAEPLDDQYAGALGPAGTVRVGGEGFAAAVPGEPALAAELHEDVGRGQHRRAAREGQVALALPQRLAGQVECHQRGGAGGVHSDRRALQTEQVGQPSGHHAVAVGDADDAFEAIGDAVEPVEVVVVHHAGEDPGAAAAQPLRVDSGALRRLPGGLQEQPLLRVHRQGLARRDAEERRVEGRGVGDEAALAACRCGRSAAGPGRRGWPGPSRGRRGRG
ncbi:hypothetical protein SANTM175S_10060 [Streptomyces antimycoticus]